MPIAAAVQMTSIHNVSDNLATAARLIKKAAAQNAKLVVLPENFALMGLDEKAKIHAGEKFGHGIIQDFLAEQAQTYQLWIVGGTIPILSEQRNKVYAACIIFNDKGKMVGRYDKIHLFDVRVSLQEQHHESATIEAGKIITVIDSPIGKLGIGVCYDLRFPELFRQMFALGAEVFVLPTAFTVPTGQAHWEVLTRSRAIENLSYFIAACQNGQHSNGRSTYGHSRLIDPWGKILAELPDGEGVITTEINLEHLRQLREKMPINKHQRIIAAQKK